MCENACWKKKKNKSFYKRASQFSSEYSSKKGGRQESSTQAEVWVVGSIGIILKALRENVFSQAEAIKMLEVLQDTSSLFITPDLINGAIEEAKKEVLGMTLLHHSSIHSVLSHV